MEKAELKPRGTQNRLIATGNYENNHLVVMQYGKNYIYKNKMWRVKK